MIQTVQIFFRKLDIRKLDIEGGLKKLPYAYLMVYWVEGSGCPIFPLEIRHKKIIHNGWVV